MKSYPKKFKKPIFHILIPSVLLSLVFISSCSKVEPIKQIEIIPTGYPTSTILVKDQNPTEKVETITNPIPIVTRIKETSTPDSVLLQSLLTSDDNCKQPCIFGFTPHGSTLQNVIDMSDKWNLEVYPDPKLVKAETYNMGYDFFLHPSGKAMTFSLNFVNDQDMITGLDFVFETGLDTYVSKTDWISFVPESIIKRYGRPDTIQIYLHPPIVENIDGFTYSLYFYYGEKQVTVEYISANLITPYNGKYTLCPGSDLFYRSRIWMGTANEGIPPKDVRYSLEENSDIDIGIFSDSLINETSTFCFKFTG
jgi:hypothetical protein